MSSGKELAECSTSSNESDEDIILKNTDSVL